MRHLGTGYSQTVLQAMEDALINQGVTIAYGENVETLLVEADEIIGVKTSDSKEIKARYVITAPGREECRVANPGGQEIEDWLKG